MPAGSICTLLSGGWQWEQMPPLLLLPRLDNLDVPHSFESAGFMGYKKKKGLVCLCGAQTLLLEPHFEGYNVEKEQKY